MIIRIYNSQFVEFFKFQEEKEKRLEEMFETDLDNAFENKHMPCEEVPEEGVVALAGKKTQETISATDLIIDALDMAEAEAKRIAEHEVWKLLTSFIIFTLFKYYDLMFCTLQKTVIMFCI